MRAMTLSDPAEVATRPLSMFDVPVPEPGPGQVLIRVQVCGVCRTDLHIVEGELPSPKRAIVPGHEVVGTIEQNGPGATRFRSGDRVGVAWLHRTCGRCRYCLRGDENLCASPTFTGYDVNGGYAEYVVADEAFIYPVPAGMSPRAVAPLLCAGIIGYRAFQRSAAKPGDALGLYGFGGSAHIVLQIARHFGCEVYVVTREAARRQLAREMGAVWAGPVDQAPPRKLQSSILFAPVGALVPVALESLDRGGTLALADIYMTPVPELDYAKDLFYERNLRSVTANTREDGLRLLDLAEQIPLRTVTQEFALEHANDALLALKEGRLEGAAAVLAIGGEESGAGP